MSSLSPIHKQCYELTASDLREHPIWEFCLDEDGEDGQDEATVRPSAEVEVDGYADGAYIVACDVRFADGTPADGYIYSGKPDDFGCIQPSVVSDAGQVNFWLGALRFIPDVERTIAGLCTKLQRDSKSMFPIVFRTRSNVNGSALMTTVKGFLALGPVQKPVAVE